MMWLTYIEIPLSESAFSIIHNAAELNVGSEWIFSNQKHTGPILAKVMKRTRDHIKEITGKHFTRHDFRRTFLTVGESLDIFPYTLKRLVGYRIEDDNNDVTAGYIVSDMDRLRQATEAITAKIFSFINKQDDDEKEPENVVGHIKQER